MMLGTSLEMWRFRAISTQQHCLAVRTSWCREPRTFSAASLDNRDTYSILVTECCQKRAQSEPANLSNSFRLRREEESETLTGKGPPAVILMAYGSPNSLDEVGEYLSQVRGGRIATQDEVEHLKERYRRVGGGTPLLQITISQAKGLEESLHSQSVPARVHFGMKHWHPFVEDVAEKIVGENPPLIIGVALA